MPGFAHALSQPLGGALQIDDLSDRNSQTLHSQGRRVGAEAKHEVVRRRQIFEDVQQMPGDGHFAHRIGQLAVSIQKPEAPRL